MTDIAPLEDTHFDYIVLGTGFIESIVAGSLARSGKKVLHLDTQENYGGNWSVFDFKDMAVWYLSKLKVFRHIATDKDATMNYHKNYASNFRHVKLILSPSINKEQREKIVTMQQNGSSIEEIRNELLPALNNKNKDLLEMFIQEQSSKKLEDIIAEVTLFADLLSHPRAYNLDTTPKLLGSREELVETLIRSGVGRYLEFRNVDDVYVYDNVNNILDKVPSSKEDVFTNKAVSLVDKRKIMKFLTFAMEYENDDTLLEGTENMTYSTFLQEKFKINGKLLNAIIYAISLVDPSISVRKGLEATHGFVSSMGRFGKGAYLSTLYGGGSEIGQAFCRICAVFGGIYILNKTVSKYEIDSNTNNITGIVTKDGECYQCKKLITNIDYMPDSWIPNRQSLGTWISRGICLSYKPLASSELGPMTKDGLSYSVFPPGSKAGNDDKPIYLIHQNSDSMTCPKDQYVTYFWTSSKCSNVIENAMDLLLKKDNEGECIFRFLYEQCVHNMNDIKQHLTTPSNVIPCSDPDDTINFQSAFIEARNIFYECESLPTEFMPAAKEEPDDDY